MASDSRVLLRLPSPFNLSVQFQTAYRWRKLRKIEDKVRALQERLCKLVENEESTNSATSSQCGPALARPARCPLAAVRPSVGQACLAGPRGLPSWPGSSGQLPDRRRQFRPPASPTAPNLHFF
ncbi:hypothetical protein COLO4_15118 [Corchorus olitorius]|uniref:Uncharacterized protein n=1 Tax=Corchorus olitorius TaxID=93759 RepID=A0A1R3JPK2_9ROSI|nr:hypothetical protein COLO4_15118 [Corchorus olitorius]